MTIIKKEDRIIYRAGKNKKVKFVNGGNKFSEIVVGLDNTRQVIEVNK